MKNAFVRSATVLFSSSIVAVLIFRAGCTRSDPIANDSARPTPAASAARSAAASPAPTDSVRVLEKGVEFLPGSKSGIIVRPPGQK